MEFEVTQSGSVQSLGLWFDAELMDGIRFASGPGTGTAYSNLALPLTAPIAVQSGDRLKVRILASDIGGTYHLSWWTTLIRAGQTIVSFQQSDFMAEPLRLERLKQRLPTHVPKLERSGEIARQILFGAHSGLSLAQIAANLMEAFPGRFENMTAAVEHTANTLELVNG